MKEPIKVYNSSEGRVGRTKRVNVVPVARMAHTMTTALAFNNRARQHDSLEAKSVPGTRDEFKYQELRFLQHYALPTWRDAIMPSSNLLVLGEVRRVCVTVSGYNQQRAHHLLTKGAQIGLKEQELKELTAQADCYIEYIKCYNIVVEQEVEQAIKFVKAYPFKTTAVELLEAAYENV